MLINNNLKLLLNASKKNAGPNIIFIARNCGKSSDDGKSAKDEKINKESEMEKSSKDIKAAHESAANKLNRLLASMQTDNQWLQSPSNIPLRPGEAHKGSKLERKTTDRPTDILEAAKNVASYFDTENKLRIESELLSKLLAASSTQNKQEGDYDKSRETADEPNTKLSDLFVGINVDRHQPVKRFSRSDYINSPSFKAKWEKNMYGQQRSNSCRNSSIEKYAGTEDLFDGKRLNIFNNLDQLKDSPDILRTWSQLEQHCLKLQVSHAPDNYFEKLILWTEQGKLWRFPIDNEQDWADEHYVDFSEHVFLEQHLESWCPSRGPLRHFMELVCVGLSKNHCLTAKEKKEHILWYRDYFQSKKDVLKDLIKTDTVLPTKQI